MTFSVNYDIVTAYFFLKVTDDVKRKERTVNKKIPLWVTIVLIFASIVCMAFGIYRGEVDTVLMKAVNICMECIGLG